MVVVARLPLSGASRRAVRHAKGIGLRDLFLDLPILTTDARELFLKGKVPPRARWRG